MTTDVLEFTCPRCTSSVREVFYGPCDSCRAELVATMGGEAREVEVAAYEPKMNVVPNNVASARNDEFEPD